MRAALLLVAITTLIYAAAVPATANPDDWSKIKNITDPYIQGLGKWLVTEHTKMGGNDGLKFQKVLSGEYQIRNGVSYRLVIDAMRPVPATANPDDWSKIKNITDPYIQGLGKWLVTEHTKMGGNDGLKFQKVLSGEYQIRNGVSYRLVIDAMRPVPATANPDDWSKIKNITDPYIQGLGKWLVTEHTKMGGNDGLKFQKVLSGEYQIRNGVSYRLVIDAMRPVPATANPDDWSKIKNITDPYIQGLGKWLVTEHTKMGGNDGLKFQKVLSGEYQIRNGVSYRLVIDAMRPVPATANPDDWSKIKNITDPYIQGLGKWLVTEHTKMGGNDGLKFQKVLSGEYQIRNGVSYRLVIDAMRPVPATANPDDWSKIKNITDPYIQGLGKWLVTEHTKMGGNDGLKFQKVLSGEYQIRNGVSYRLVIDAMRPVPATANPDDWSKIKNITDPYIQGLGKWLVTEHTKMGGNDGLKFQKVLSGEYQIRNGVSYRLVIDAMRPVPATANPDDWSKIKNITDPYIQGLGKWLVTEHTKMGGNDGLKFQKVLSGEYQIRNGVSYRLVIDAMRPVPATANPDDWSKIKNITDPYIQGLGKWLVTEHTKMGGNDGLKFQKWYEAFWQNPKCYLSFDGFDVQRAALLLVAITTLIYAAAVPATANPDDWSKIKNITDPYIQGLGKWLVTEHTKMGGNDGLKFQKWYEAFWQNPKCYLSFDGFDVQRAALLLVAITTLIYAAAVPATANPDDWSKIKNITDPYIQGLGKWLVTEHTKMGGNDGLKFQKVLSGEYQIRNGVSYRLVIDAMRPGGSHGTYKGWLLQEVPSNQNTWKLVNFSPLD
ncbi:hypothetical protein QYE76_033956 [Lolium multiflorum]|uniref:Cystatin domain-containing protein n=1 Tax=Lolium multiflorum TaxID=4521 RepID=A0AAD8QWF5_LOLMU|nr:hypothetical protein QYE76_033956 [Lolium multiflorum]